MTTITRKLKAAAKVVMPPLLTFVAVIAAFEVWGLLK